MVEFLEKLSPKVFNIDELTNLGKDYCPEANMEKLYKDTLKLAAEKGKPEKGCNTAACAMGYMPIIFPRTWNYDKWGSIRNESNVLAEEFLGIRNLGHESLFYGSAYNAKTVTPKMVARKLRKIINES